MKRILSIFIALAMVAVTPLTAFAKDWYLEDGDIKITANENGQFVTQGDVTEKDDNITITQKYEDETESTISVETEDDVTAKFTIKDVNISVEDEYKSVIDISSSNAEITVKGENHFYHQPDWNEHATIRVGSGSLTIKGDGTLDIEGDSNGAKIGSNWNEDMSGTIHITDKVTIVTDDDGTLDGAAIGSGERGDFTGKIIIDGKADVTAIANDRGAGIGAGERGDFHGEITIGGNAKVYAEGNDGSAGIGSGKAGSFSGGSITIKNNAKVTAVGDDEGPAIGAAYYESLDGDIIIKGNASVYLKGGENSPEIGSDSSGDDKGSIYIIGNSKVFLYDIDDLYWDIGSRYEGSFGGKIYIGNNAKIGEAKGSDILKDIEAAKPNYNIYLNAESENIGMYNNNSIDIDDIFDFIEENIKSESPSVPTVGENAIDEVEESNPNTGAPVILMDSHSVVFIPVAVTAKKRED